ncbi:MAG: secretin and TonB N-terminal domain-containing protein [Candidatus Omnitrophica bacterium]|nr:secretin and TonB N-terminal domain-containing protein [Candidatus Omnitrophota bacterium]
MFKVILTICLWVTVFFGGSVQVWPEDMEDRFINPDLDTSKTVFLDLKDASLTSVLKSFSLQTGLSFIAASDVADKSITLYLNKVPLNQALQMVLDANGLTYEMKENTNIFVVKASDKAEKVKITKVFPLKYATVSSSKLNSTIALGGGGGKAGGLEDVIKNSLSKDGLVVEDTRTNSLVITDVPSQFDIIESTIAKLDVPVPQVLIEVEMLDVAKSLSDQIGISYGALNQPVISFSGGSKSTNYPFSVSTAKPGTPPYTPGGFSAVGMTAALNAFSQNQNVRTLARPRILTVNNETAQIEISTHKAIDVVPSSASAGTAGSVQTYTVDRADTGVSLKVTPQADLLTREITLAVSPKVIDIVPSKVEPPAGSTSGALFDPETRGSDSILKLKDGQSMVIGGLMNNTNNTTINKIPFFGNLPLIGSLFRSSDVQKEDRELLIFLTPHIVDDINQTGLKANAVTAQKALDIQDASDRIQAIDNNLNTFEKH